ncbi:MAG: hypothetical protein ISR86_10915 [Nitrospinaceae bacterium]|nr:hypothetical protein [Nitrospinaceae bacterium]
MKNKASCLLLVLLVQAFLFFGFVVPSAYAQKTINSLKKYKVEILPLNKQVRKKYKLKLIHPYSFQLKTLQKSLVALKFKKKNIFNVKQGRIFNNALVKHLAPLIQKKFSQANSSQRISFQIPNASGAAYIQGDTFLTSEGLHWRFTLLRGVKWGIEDFSVSGEPWILVLQKEQAYKQRYWKGSTQLAQDIVNWVIFKNVLPTSSRKLPEPASHPQTQKDKESHKKHTASGIKERLHLLKQLQEENVITEKEYARKRREILGQF